MAKKKANLHKQKKYSAHRDMMIPFKNKKRKLEGYFRRRLNWIKNQFTARKITADQYKEKTEKTKENMKSVLVGLKG